MHLKVYIFCLSCVVIKLKTHEQIDMKHNYAKCESEKLIVPLSEKTVQFKKKYDLYPAFSTLKRLDDLKISSFTVNIGQQKRKFIMTNTLSLGFLFGEPIKMNTITTR